MQRQGLKIRLRMKKKKKNRSSETKERSFPPYLLEVYKLLCTHYALQLKEEPQSGFRLFALYFLYFFCTVKIVCGKENEFQV